jgi:mannose/cellobiose epimerase-like protein (N-acyl-D-glucosamine 2-epimerase family)
MASTYDEATRKALQDRRRILYEQPDVRWINLIETDGVSTTTRKHLVTSFYYFFAAIHEMCESAW